MSIRHVKVRKQWRYQARVAFGGLRASRLCRTREAAREAETALLEQLRAKVGASLHADNQPATLRALFEHYVADLEARGKGPDTVGRAAQTARAIEEVMPGALDQPLSEFGGRAILAFRHARDRAGVKAATINRDLRVIRAMLKRALPEFRFPAGAFFPEDETRVRWLQAKDETLVLEPMASPFKEIAQLAAFTLMRLSEIRLLRREFVHLQQGIVLLPRAKGGARPVVLSEAAQKILRRQLDAQRSEWVFPNRQGRPYSRYHVSRVFRKAARAAGLRDFRFHDLRHHGATMALNAGFTAPIVMMLGGWKSEKMMRRYAAVTDRTLRAAAEAISGGHVRPSTIARGKARRRSPGTTEPQ
jgi:integrase